MDTIPDFDIAALFAALDEQRKARALSWRGVADALWAQSAVLNARRGDHPISPATITGMARRGDTTCQHALFMLRWLGRSAESYVPGAIIADGAAALPAAGADQRLRWNLRALYAAMDARRHECDMTWQQLAVTLRCTPSQLTGLRTARFATSMVLAMRIVQWLKRPASDFIYAAQW
jgi:hypothetical protein